MADLQIGFIGAGNMAEAIAGALIKSRQYDPGQLLASDPAPARRQVFKEQLKIPLAGNNVDLVRRASTVLLAVKPQQLPAVLDEIAGEISEAHLVVSIAAGISTKFIESKIGKSVAVVRTMPNTPLMVGAGMTALAAGQFANQDHLDQARALFATAGRVVVVDEPLIDAVTAVSGSGPAYFFYLAEAMIDAAGQLGVDEQAARTLAAMTCFGAGKMMLECPDPPDRLRAKVTSPGGTTEAAVKALEARSVRDAWIAAIHAAARRSKELGK